MADELELSAAARKPAAKKAEKAAPEWPKFLKSNTRFGYTDPETGIRFQPSVPVRVDAAPAQGSWLESQMIAGYIGQA